MITSADGKYALVATSGYNAHELTAIELATGKKAAVETVNQSWFGLAFDSKRERCWIAERDGSCIGTVSAVRRDDRFYIRGMATIPAARGLGIGRALLEHVEAYARMSDFSQLELRTTPFLTDAISLYERTGFSRTHDGPTDHFGTPTFTMTKPLEA